MLFNSLDFAVFLPIVFGLYWFVFKNKLKAQNLLIVAASYLFYGWWDYRFLALILFSTIVDYSIGRFLANEERSVRRTLLIWISIVVNLGFLGFFKYYNFFLDNFVMAFSFLGQEISSSGLNIILPVGISFYTFQTLSYTIDVYKRNLEPTEDFIGFMAFVSFFPQLVAGPIERATNLLPQFYERRVFEYSKAVDGLRQILWGLFKKIVIADQCAALVNPIFDNSDNLSGSTLIWGAFLFAFQIYGDFSGYSDIAIGTSRLFGFNLMKNFSFPYFSRDIAEFWRRWHISLSTWFRDYLYIPLGGSRGGLKMKLRNTFIIFLVSGFWHGANWTFIVWGGLNALYFLPLLLTKRNRQNIDIIGGSGSRISVRDVLNLLGTFLLTLLAWVFFRAENVHHAFRYLNGIFDRTVFNPVQDFSGVLLLLIGLFLVIEWFGRESEFAIEHIGLKVSGVLRWSFYIVLALLIVAHMDNQQDFIYFQF
ncbi:MBOAT family O-acyltransferase [Aureicoccus marinus]|uniref:Membrane-bound O-acyltransferase family protein n=1 Tax=Aureicoccus marinus TaxID=754435 RepID=A0A2S7T5N1_9FLAO|nr:MBOAT family O-acyltransferase [Aureicoccus marinus]PQJ15223.1 membrane-bound O-acyltransferase family protein [Aureicoccus marinus]